VLPTATKVVAAAGGNDRATGPRETPALSPLHGITHGSVSANLSDKHDKACCSLASETVRMSETNQTSSIALVWLPELCEQLGRSKYSIDRWVKAGHFPPPIKIHSQGLAWRVRDIEAFFDKLARTRKKVKRRGSLMRGDTLVEYSKRREAADA
jgi:predicted DNA-binding transcriptional regulator AlpA